MTIEFTKGGFLFKEKITKDDSLHGLIAYCKYCNWVTDSRSKLDKHVESVVHKHNLKNKPDAKELSEESVNALYEEYKKEEKKSKGPKKYTKHNE